MARVKRRGPDRRESWRHELTLNQELGFLLGPAGSGFKSEEEAQAAWEIHRDALMAEWGRGPGWWKYELGEPVPSRMVRGVEFPPPWTAAHVRLFELGELTEEEVSDLERRARNWNPESLEAPKRWDAARIDTFMAELRSLHTEEKP
jgi:hypothetical protein